MSLRFPSSPRPSSPHEIAARRALREFARRALALDILREEEDRTGVDLFESEPRGYCPEFAGGGKAPSEWATGPFDRQRVSVLDLRFPIA
ncbi:MAG: hypothetical protein OXD36_05705 [Rhodobacter sp.]|nr:hypothetical protein [Rhodobacter sp.]MCY4241220.1 hypothetical protein [Rhodobacter sp.]